MEEKVGHSFGDEGIGYRLLGLVLVARTGRVGIYDEHKAVLDIAKGYLALVFGILSVIFEISVKRLDKCASGSLVRRAAVLEKARVVIVLNAVYHI